MLESQSVLLRDGAARLMIGDDRGDLHRQLVDAPPVQQVDQAVVVLRHHDEDSPDIRLQANAQFRGEPRRVLGGSRGDGWKVAVGLEAGAHEEQAGVDVGVLLLLEDIGADSEEPGGDGVDDARAVGALQGQDVRGHVYSSKGESCPVFTS